MVEHRPVMQPLSDKPAPGWAPPLDEQDATGAVEWLLQFASRHKASDVHLQLDRETCPVQLRLDGVLVSVGELPGEAAARILGRVKYLVEQAGLKPVPDRLQRTPAALAKANGHAAVSEYLESQ